MARTVTLTLTAEQADTVLDALQEASERAETESADVYAPIADEILRQTGQQITY